MGKTNAKHAPVEMSYDEMNAEWARIKEEVRDRYRLDRAIEDFAGVNFKTSGQSRKMCCCPFHQEKTPSFSVDVDKGFFICFGNGCGESGDLFSFIQKHENISFREALIRAADNVGVVIPDQMRDGKMVIKSTGKKRTYDENALKMDPANLEPCDLIPVPDDFPVPKPGQAVWGWSHGSSDRPAGPRKHPAKMVHEYRDVSGQLISCVLRIEKGQGKGKFFMPMRVEKMPEEAPDYLLNEGRLGWGYKGAGSNTRRPIYGIENTVDWLDRGGRDILLVEGEKTKDAAQRIMEASDEADQWMTISPMGGSNASLYPDWDGFVQKLIEAGSPPIRLTVWPDADPMITKKDGAQVDPQAVYSSEIYGGLISAMTRHGLSADLISATRVRPPKGVAKGWDLADAEAETWSSDEVLDRIKNEAVLMEKDSRYVVEIEDENDAGGASFSSPFPEPQGCGDTQLNIIEMMLSEDDEMCDGGNDMASGASVDGKADPSVEDLSLPDDEDALKEVAPSVMPSVISTLRDGSDPKILGIPDVGQAPVEKLGEAEVVDEEGNRGDDLDAIRTANLRDNPHFRCLGHLDNVFYFLSLKAGSIVPLTAGSMKANQLMSVAPLGFWRLNYEGLLDRDGNRKVDWEGVVDGLIQTNYKIGMWKPELQAGQGAHIDNGRVVFNTGTKLWVANAEIPDVVTREEDLGVKQDLNAAYGDDDEDDVICDNSFKGKFAYLSAPPAPLPDFMGFRGRREDPEKLLDIIRALNWQKAERNLSILSLFGWLAIGPICGVLPWRPHLYLDGERGAGKSWIIQNIIRACLSEYAIFAKSNSSESGLRNTLNGKAFPLIFDEAEGETVMDRSRMDNVMALARHSATPGASVVAQGVPGGGGRKFYAIKSTFLMASITPQMHNSADKTRFARARLGPAHRGLRFTETIANPALELLTEDFSRRLIGQMVSRAADMEKVQHLMHMGMNEINLEPRMADVYATYAAGAWLLLEEGVPESISEAIRWLEERFSVMESIADRADEMDQEKDHIKLFRTITSSEVRCESPNVGTRYFSVGSVIEMACGVYEFEDGMSPEEADRKLSSLGIRIGHGRRLRKPGETPDGVLVHKASPHITKILEQTPYGQSYADVMEQSEGVYKVNNQRFNGMGTFRAIRVPLSLLFGEGYNDNW